MCIESLFLSFEVRNEASAFSFSLFFPYNSGNETEKENYYSLRTIGEGAFMNCDILTKANVPATFTVVENYVFKGVSQITVNTLNSKTTTIGIGSFQDCTKLAKFVIPSKVTSIGALAFGNCTSLKTITFQTQSCEFGGECFKNCLALQEFTFPKEAHLDVLGGFFENCASLTKCTMPKTLKDKNGIQSSTLNMFSNCQNLATVILPDNIDSLGTRMFQNTSIETIYLPKSVNTIGAETLKDCTKLKYVNVSNTDKINLSLNIFENTPNLEILSIHGNLAMQLGKDMFGGKKFCYYGTSNPKGSKLCLDPNHTTVYVTKTFDNMYDYFGSATGTGIDQFNGYPFKVMEGDVCSFPGEPPLPNETETLSISEELSETPLNSESLDASQSEPLDISSSMAPSRSDNNNNDDHKKKKKLSTGAIIGIVLGCLAFLALLLLLIICCCKKHKRDLKNRDDLKDSSIGLKKQPSKKGYESVDNLQENQPEKLMV